MILYFVKEPGTLAWLVVCLICTEVDSQLYSLIWHISLMKIWPCKYFCGHSPSCYYVLKEMHFKLYSAFVKLDQELSVASITDCPDMTLAVNHGFTYGCTCKASVEPRHLKTGLLPMRKQRRRSASQ